MFSQGVEGAAGLICTKVCKVGGHIVIVIVIDIDIVIVIAPRRGAARRRVSSDSKKEREKFLYFCAQW